jgi:cell shape-determining protein MreC
MFEQAAKRTIFARPHIILAATLLAGLLVALLPRRAVEPLRHLYGRIIEPGHVLAGQLVARGSGLVERAHHTAATAEEITALTAAAEKLRARNRELETALALSVAQNSRAAADNLSAAAPLVLTEGILARVLGRRACAVLPNAEIVAVGSASGIRHDALALVDSEVTIDAGRDSQVVSGDMALAGRRVYGKVVEVGQHTCVIRRADQASYRDVVQLVRLTDGKSCFGPTGMLEGAGQRKCRVRMISAGEDVAPGDLVFTASEQGLATQPILYGTVVRCDRAHGAPHWDIQVELADEREHPNHLVVLRSTLNPARVAAISETTESE